MSNSVGLKRKLNLIIETDVHNADASGLLNMRLWLVPFDLEADEDSCLQNEYERSFLLASQGLYNELKEAADRIALALVFLGFEVTISESLND